jgi:ribosomal-protein-alanine N-acetyltransferase
MIRPVDPQDFQELLAIEKEAFPKSEYDLGEFWRLYQHYPQTFLVTEREQIDGYIVFSPDGHIISMAVALLRRRQGVGTRLIQEAITYCDRTALSLEVRVSNWGAQEFYERLGFIVRGTATGYYLDGEDALLMERPAG